jgi:nucleotide-binding universal stress UspA family protein
MFLPKALVLKSIKTSNMKDRQVKIEYDFLVLTDFSEASYIALKYVISMAKLIKSTIHVYHVANLEKIVESDNPLMVTRDIELETKRIEEKIGSIIEIITAEGINAIPHCSMGDIICEFEDQINLINPDLVILGNKKVTPCLSGKVMGYLMNEYKGSLLIVAKESEFHSGTKISLSCNNNIFDRYDPHMLFSLERNTKVPLTLLNVKKQNNSIEAIIIPQDWVGLRNKIDRNLEVEYENDALIVDGLLKLISSNNIELLCIGKGKPRNFLQKLIPGRTSIVSDIVNQINVPILLLGTNSNL